MADLRNLIQLVRRGPVAPPQSSGFGWGGPLANQLSQRTVTPGVAAPLEWKKFGDFPATGNTAFPGGYEVPREPYPGMTPINSEGSGTISTGEEMEGPRIFPTIAWGAGVADEGDTSTWGLG